MCGIVGFIRPSDKIAAASNDWRLFMKHSLVLDTIRGDDATGIFFKEAGKAGKSGWLKNAVAGQVFINTKEYSAFEKSIRDQWFCMGHNRAATVGGLGTSSAHPFSEGGVTMIHNGTLTSTVDLPQSQKQLGVDVDSHAVCHNLALVKPDEVEKVVSKIDGAFALVWYDRRDESLNICRNADRPFHMAQAVDGTIYMASEAGLLRWMDTKLRLSLGEIVQPTAGTHLKFSKGSMLPLVQEYSLLPKKYYDTFQGNGGYGGNWYGTRSAAGTTRQTSTNAAFEKDTILVNSKWEVIPSILQEELLSAGFSINDRFSFTPLTDISRTGKRRVVAGHLDTLGVTALLHGTFESVVDGQFDNRWLVRPIGVKYSDDEVVLICRLVNSNTTPDMEVFCIPDALEEEAARDKDVYYIGTQKATKDAWEEAIKDGCMWCGDDFSSPVLVEWTRDLEPVCDDCMQFAIRLNN